MKNDYQPYSEYKSTYIKWVENIPKHWEIKRLKFLLSSPLKYGANEAAELTEPTFPRYIRITDVKEDGTLREKTFRSLNPDIAEDYLLIDGDILLARSGATVGKTFIYKPSWGVAAYAGYLIRARFSEQMDADFAYLFFQSSCYWQWLNSIFIQATIQNVSAEKYANLQLPFPPKEEQKTIAKFLDYKTAKIDALIAKKKKLLEKLEEKRTALISHAVTKGLDPSVPMRDSGIDWLGEIPEHWNSLSIHFIGRLKSGSSITALEFKETGKYPVYGGNGFRGYFDEYTHDGEYVLIGRQGALCGNINYASGKFYATEHAIVVNPTKKFEPFWLGELLKTMNLNQYSISAAQPGLSAEVIGRLTIPFPPLAEQKDISNFLKLYINQIKKQKNIINKAIHKLQEYRSALITNAITGKIDVRDFKIPDQPETGEANA